MSRLAEPVRQRGALGLAAQQELLAPGGRPDFAQQLATLAPAPSPPVAADDLERDLLANDDLDVSQGNLAGAGDKAADETSRAAAKPEQSSETATKPAGPAQSRTPGTPVGNKLGRPGDPWEKQADEVAEAAVRGTDPDRDEKGECIPCKMKALAGGAAPTTQRKEMSSGERKSGTSVDSLVNSGATVVDVREPDEFAAGHAVGALNIPLGELESSVGLLDPGQPVIIYCARGRRSAIAADLLRGRGFGEVVDIATLDAWPGSTEAGTASNGRTAPQAKLAGIESSASPDAVLRSAPGPGEPLSGAVKSRVEPLVGADLGGVRVHDSAPANAVADGLNAKAVTRGSDIWLGSGQSANDMSLMAHEATHTVQQSDDAAAPQVQALSMSDVADAIIPDWVRGAITGAASRARSVAAGLPAKAQSLTSGIVAQGEGEAAAAQGSGEATAAQSDAAAGATQVGAVASAGGIQAGAESQAGSVATSANVLKGAGAQADHEMDPVKPLLGNGPLDGVKPADDASAAADPAAATPAPADPATAAAPAPAKPAPESAAPAPEGPAAKTPAPDTAAAAPAASGAAGAMDFAAQALPAAPKAAGSELSTKPKPPGGGKWDCSEAEIIKKVSKVKAEVVDQFTTASKALKLDKARALVSEGVAKTAEVAEGLKSRADEVAEDVRTRVGTVKDAATQRLQQAETAAKSSLDEVDKGAEGVIGVKLSTVGANIAALSGRVDAGVAKLAANVTSAVGGVLSKGWKLAKEYKLHYLLAGLAAPAALVAAPILLARAVGSAAAAQLKNKNSFLRKALDGIKQRVKTRVVTAWKAVSTVVKGGYGLLKKAHAEVVQGARWLGNKAKDTVVGKKVRQVQEYFKGLADKQKMLKGEACQAIGPYAGPCVRQMLPTPEGGKDNKAFHDLSLKGDLTVPFKKVLFVKLAAGAKIHIAARGDNKYEVVISGQGVVTGGVGGSAGGGKTANQGSIGGSVDGSLPKRIGNRLKAMNKLNGVPNPPEQEDAKTKPEGKGEPAPGGAPAGVPSPFPSMGGVVPSTPVVKGQELSKGGSGLAPSGKLGVGYQGEATATYEFDASKDHNTCEGAGGLATFVAGAAGAQVLPLPWSLQAGALANSFAPKSVEMKAVQVGEASGEVAGGVGAIKGEAKVEAGVRNKIEVDKDHTVVVDKGDGKMDLVEQKGTVSTVAMFQKLSGSVGVEAFGGYNFGVLAGSVEREVGMSYSFAANALCDAFITNKATGSMSLSVAQSTAWPIQAIASRLDLIHGTLQYPNKAKVTVEVDANVRNVQRLVLMLDALIEKEGDSITAGAVWDIIKDWLKKNGFSSTLVVKLEIGERIAGAKGGAGMSNGKGNAGGLALEGEWSAGDERVLYKGEWSPR